MNYYILFLHFMWYPGTDLGGGATCGVLAPEFLVGGCHIKSGFIDNFYSLYNNYFKYILLF